MSGPFNIQFLVKEHKPFVIEVNLRASRTFPLLSKAMDVNFAEVAVDAFFGKAKNMSDITLKMSWSSPRSFLFARLSGADPIFAGGNVLYRGGGGVR